MFQTAPGPTRERDAREDPGPVLLLPGQGAQYPGMGTGLYRDEPDFTAAADEVFHAMGASGDALRADWLAERPAVPMDDATRSQPLLFTLDYALGRLLLARGVRPHALLGHSIGETAAATLAGVFTLHDAVRLVLDRIADLTSAPAGGMLAVAASVAELDGKLPPGVEVGAVNAPRQTVVAGPADALARAAAELRAAGLVCVPVPSRTPFHSAALEPVVRTGLHTLRGTRMEAPRIPMISGYTARRLDAVTVTDPQYWARHPVDPVLFWPALETALASGARLLVECGPGQGLVTLARRHPAVRSGQVEVLALLGPRTGDPGEEAAHFRAAAREFLERLAV
ncbi:acyltransferase domain-containing protein [Streptomyces sp. NPDC102381]|uniref:acyltransferase domain-containing protein n=1 Tax=Streptomyces sp. NPDC102381 TaxID=3366164 RepID=UPI003821E42E